MKIAYVAGPYRAPTPYGIAENILNARRVALWLWSEGYAVVTPHLNTAHFDGACPDETWLEGDKLIMLRCDLVVLVPGWELSTGTRAEIEAAETAGMAVYEFKGDRIELLTRLPF